ncbi:hypothetical protein GCM10010103_65410 [Streptomyces paradoxus]
MTPAIAKHTSYNFSVLSRPVEEGTAVSLDTRPVPDGPAVKVGRGLRRTGDPRQAYWCSGAPEASRTPSCSSRSAGSVASRSATRRIDAGRGPGIADGMGSVDARPAATTVYKC